MENSSIQEIISQDPTLNSIYNDKELLKRNAKNIENFLIQHKGCKPDEVKAFLDNALGEANEESKQEENESTVTSQESSEQTIDDEKDGEGNATTISEDSNIDEEKEVISDDVTDNKADSQIVDEQSHGSELHDSEASVEIFNAVEVNNDAGDYSSNQKDAGIQSNNGVPQQYNQVSGPQGNVQQYQQPVAQQIPQNYGQQWQQAGVQQSNIQQGQQTGAQQIPQNNMQQWQQTGAQQIQQNNTQQWQQAGVQQMPQGNIQQNQQPGVQQVNIQPNQQAAAQTFQQANMQQPQNTQQFAQVNTTQNGFQQPFVVAGQPNAGAQLPQVKKENFLTKLINKIFKKKSQ